MIDQDDGVKIAMRTTEWEEICDEVSTILLKNSLDVFFEMHPEHYNC